MPASQSNSFLNSFDVPPVGRADRNRFAVPRAQICPLSASLAGITRLGGYARSRCPAHVARSPLLPATGPVSGPRSILWFDWGTSSSPITVSLAAPLREPLGMDAINRAAANCFEFFASMDERPWLALVPFRGPDAATNAIWVVRAPSSIEKVIKYNGLAGICAHLWNLIQCRSSVFNSLDRRCARVVPESVPEKSCCGPSC